MYSSAKEFLTSAIADYNTLFKTNFSADSNGFQNYYRDLAEQVKAKEIDLLISRWATRLIPSVRCSFASEPRGSSSSSLSRPM